MKKKIENIEELRAEIKRLKSRREDLKVTLKEDVEGIKDYFKPLSLFFNTASAIAGAAFGRETFIKNLFLSGLRNFISPAIKKVFERAMEFFRKRKKE